MTAYTDDGEFMVHIRDLDVVLAVDGIGYTFSLAGPPPSSPGDAEIDVMQARLTRVLRQLEGMRSGQAVGE